MSTETQIETVQKLVQPLLFDDLFLVEIKVKPVNNIKIFLDADSGLGIEKCIKINRALYKVMEEPLWRTAEKAGGRPFPPSGICRHGRYACLPLRRDRLPGDLRHRE